MSEIHEIRRANIKAIIGTEKVAQFARRNGLADKEEYLRQLIRGVREVGREFASVFESALNLEQGALDKSEPDADLLKNAFARKVAKEADAREIPQHMQQTVLYMLRTAPEKATPDGTA